MGPSSLLLCVRIASVDTRHCDRLGGAGCFCRPLNTPELCSWTLLACLGEGPCESLWVRFLNVLGRPRAVLTLGLSCAYPVREGAPPVWEDPALYPSS